MLVVELTAVVGFAFAAQVAMVVEVIQLLVASSY